MARLPDIHHRLMSPPCKVHFAGWESTTDRLQSAGWKLSADQDIERRRMRLALKFEPAQVYMMSESVDFEFFGMAYGDYRSGGVVHRMPVFRVFHLATDIRVQMMGDLDFSRFEAIDARPRMETVEIKSIKDLAIFAPAQVRTEEIIVAPQDVATLMEQIRKLQEPELAAIRQRNRVREAANKPMPEAIFHAQILSIAA